MLHHCFEGFIYRNEINAKNVFCHVKCFEKNENVWKVTRVAVFCQEIFGLLENNTTKIEQISYVWCFLRPSYILQMQHRRSRIMICSCRFQRKILVQYLRLGTYVWKNTALTVPGPSLVQPNVKFYL